jgi:hypothetical protein
MRKEQFESAIIHVIQICRLTEQANLLAKPGLRLDAFISELPQRRYEEYHLLWVISELAGLGILQRVVKKSGCVVLRRGDRWHMLDAVIRARGWEYAGVLS